MSGAIGERLISILILRSMAEDALLGRASPRFAPETVLKLIDRIDALEAAHREIVALDERGGSGGYECSAISRRALGDEG